jgi:pimeloyl-ACP methyl ester carboxylesterase
VVSAAYDPGMDRLVLVHGAGLNAAAWQLQTEHFEDAVALDLPGHGDSTQPAADSIASYAAWVAGQLRTASPSPVTLVGHSMGSLIALEAAARNPDMVGRLVLISTAARMPVNPKLLTAATQRDPAAAAMVIRWSFPKDPSFGRPKKWVASISDTFIAAAESGLLGLDFAACNAYHDAVAMAERVRCPTLLILGEKDVMTEPKAAQPLAVALTDARIVVVANAGHMLPLERPDEVNEAIGLFRAV